MSRVCVKIFERILLKKIQTRSRSWLILWSGSTGPCLKKV